MVRSHLDRPVTVGLNLLPILPGESGGTETYVQSLLRSIDKESSDRVRYVAYLSHELSGSLEIPSEVATVDTGIRAERRSVRYLFEQTILPWVAAVQGVEVLFCPGYVSPVISPVKTVPVVHDTNYNSVPKTMSLVRRMALSLFVPLSVWTATAVVTVSEFSKSEIIETTPVSRNDISVVHNPLPPTLPEPSGCVNTYLDGCYVLYVGNNYPHKHVGDLVKAVPSLDDELHLVVVGFDPEPDGELLQRVDALGIEERVHFRGQVSQQELADLYAGAMAYVHPSEYEGFGFPLIEAMYYDTPVVAHKAAAIPETAGDAAVYFTDCTANSIARAVAEVQNKKRRTELIAAGQKNLERFTMSQFICRIEEILIGVAKRNSDEG